jgi:XTP/dITP diphosphohydrolase
MDNLSSKEEKLQAFSRLLDIMDELREKCPWDKKQTLESLRHLTIEETYELADAIIKNDLKELEKELGDVLLHIVFYARITSEMGLYDISHVIHTLCEKLIVRHPHIYGNVQADTEEQVKENWEQIKLKEGNKSVLSGVSKGAPSLVKAYRMQEKAAQVGFDWETGEQVWAKVHEELQEFKEELAQPNNKEKTEQEYHNPVTDKMEKVYTTKFAGNRSCDWEGLKREQDRIQNGFRLFGKYYQNLWD